MELVVGMGRVDGLPEEDVVFATRSSGALLEQLRLVAQPLANGGIETAERVGAGGPVAVCLP